MAVIIEIGIVMLSALKRLRLCEQAYGFTTLRLYSHFFIIVLAVVFVLLAAHIWRRQASQHFGFSLLACGIIALAILNMINPDAVIAKENIIRYTQTNKIDTGYLAHLSADASTVIAKQAANKSPQQTVLQQLLVDQLKAHRSSEHWQSYNFSKQHVDSLYRTNVAKN